MPVSNIDQTAAGLFAIMTSKKGGEEARRRQGQINTNIRDSVLSLNTLGGKHHECGSTQGEMDAVQRRAETEVR
jgi:hypothetical protein